MEDDACCNTCSHSDADLCHNTHLRSTGRHTMLSGAPGWDDGLFLAHEIYTWESVVTAIRKTLLITRWEQESTNLADLVKQVICSIFMLILCFKFSALWGISDIKTFGSSFYSTFWWSVNIILRDFFVSLYNDINNSPENGTKNFQNFVYIYITYTSYIRQFQT